MALEEKECDHHVFDHAMIRGRYKQQATWPQQTREFEKEPVDIVDVLDHFRAENCVKTFVWKRCGLLWADYTERFIGESPAVIANDGFRNVETVSLVTE